ERDPAGGVDDVQRVGDRRHRTEQRVPLLAELGHEIAGVATGSSTETRVPSCGGLTSAKRPPSASTRSTRPVRPDPVLGSAPPMPSSAIVALRSPVVPCATATEISDARACLIAFATASEIT